MLTYIAALFILYVNYHIGYAYAAESMQGAVEYAYNKTAQTASGLKKHNNFTISLTKKLNIIQFLLPVVIAAIFFIIARCIKQLKNKNTSRRLSEESRNACVIEVDELNPMPIFHPLQEIIDGGNVDLLTPPFEPPKEVKPRRMRTPIKKVDSRARKMFTWKNCNLLGKVTIGIVALSLTAQATAVAIAVGNNAAVYSLGVGMGIAWAMTLLYIWQTDKVKAWVKKLKYKYLKNQPEPVPVTEEPDEPDAEIFMVDTAYENVGGRLVMDFSPRDSTEISDSTFNTRPSRGDYDSTFDGDSLISFTTPAHSSVFSSKLHTNRVPQYDIMEGNTQPPLTMAEDSNPTVSNGVYDQVAASPVSSTVGDSKSVRSDGFEDISLGSGDASYYVINEVSGDDSRA